MFKRTQTYSFNIGNKQIGGKNDLLIQTMSDIKTSKVNEVINQILECEKYGCDLIRVSVLDQNDAKAIKKIKEKIHIPLIADIHFSYKLALLAIENGADKIRINPGNIGSFDNLTEIINLAKKHDIAIRIGINSGSLKLKDNKNEVNYMLSTALTYINFFEKNNFKKLVISLKSSDPINTIKVYTKISQFCKYPLHLGITEAGPKDISLIRSTASLSPILIKGIGDTIRISITGNPKDEVIAARRLLNDLKIRTDIIKIVSCPTCGRTEVNLKDIVQKIEEFSLTQKKSLTVAIMGCPVNGPGEARNADIGLAGGANYYLLFKKGIIYKKLNENEALEELLKEIKNY